MNDKDTAALIEHFFDDIPVSTADAAYPDIYFERLGGLCAILLATGRREVTADNVSVTGGYPVIRNLQVNDPSRERQQMKQLRRIDPSLYFSLFNSNLIFRYTEFKEDTLLIPKDGRSPLLPVINGRPLQLCDHQKPFFKGFSAAYIRCMSDPAFHEAPLRLSDDDLNFEIFLLRKAILEPNLTDRLQKPRDMEDKADPAAKEGCIFEAEHIFRELKDTMLLSPGGSCCFFYTPLLNHTRKMLSGVSLTKGISGIAVFTAAVSKHAMDPQLRAEAAELTFSLLSQLERYLEYFDSLEKLDEKSCTVSFSEGLGGLLFAVMRIKQILNGSETTAQPDRIIRHTVELILRSDPSGYLPDCYNGLAGTLKVLSTSHEIFSMPGVKAFCEKLADAIISARKQTSGALNIWPVPGRNDFMSGSAHGQIGIASALYTAGEKLGRKDYIEAAMDGFQFEDETYDRKNGCWPDLRPILPPGLRPPAYGYCAGAAGIGLNTLGKEGDIFSRNLKRAISSCLNTDLLPADNLCCGNCAVIDFLLEAGRELHRNDLIEEAQKRLQKLYHRSFDDSVPGYRLPSDHLLSTLYYGLPGIGYTLLRTALPDRLPDILLK